MVLQRERNGVLLDGRGDTIPINVCMYKRYLYIPVYVCVYVYIYNIERERDNVWFTGLAETRLAQNKIP